MIKVSVIVAVYQVEKFIRKCLDSLQNQTMSDFEVLLIDDGSKDLSGIICDEYAANDSHFRVIHKENGGVSSARQTGLENAVGEYVIHVDPDDWVEKDMLENLYNEAKANNYDMVVCDYYKEFKGTTTYIKQQPQSEDHKLYFYDVIHRLHGSCCNKLVRRSCFTQYNVSFFPNMIMWEDQFVILKLAEQPIKISYLPKAFYHYDESSNNNSAVRSWSRKKLESQRTVISWLEQKNDPQINKEIVNLKKDAKKTAFFTKDVNSYEFKHIYSEVNKYYTFKATNFGRGEDFYIFLALRSSLKISRFFYSCKSLISKLLRTL